MQHSLLPAASSSILIWWVYLSPSDGAASPFSAPRSSILTRSSRSSLHSDLSTHLSLSISTSPHRQNSCKSRCILLSATDKVSLAGGRQVAEQFAYRLFWDISKEKACISLLKERTLFMFNRFILQESWCEILLFSFLFFREGNPCPVDLSKEKTTLI